MAVAMIRVAFMSPGARAYVAEGGARRAHTDGRTLQVLGGDAASDDRSRGWADSEREQVEKATPVTWAYIKGQLMQMRGTIIFLGSGRRHWPQLGQGRACDAQARNGVLTASAHAAALALVAGRFPLRRRPAPTPTRTVAPQFARRFCWWLRACCCGPRPDSRGKRGRRLWYVPASAQR